MAQNTISQSTIDAESNTKIQTDSQHGVLGSWWQLAIGMGETSSNFGFGLAQDTRAELRRRVDLTLTFAEDMGVGTFTFVRKVVDRADRVVSEALGRSEAAMLVMTRTLRKTGHGVTDFATSTLTDTIGTSPTQRKDTRAAAAA